jgi:hypothetical protein
MERSGLPCYLEGPCAPSFAEEQFSVVAVPEEAKRKQHYLFKSITTDQYGHFDLGGLAPGKYNLFSWDGVEQGEWEDTDFLKDSEDKGVTIDLKGSDRKAIELKLIQLKSTATARE